MDEDVTKGGAPATMLDVVDLRVDFSQAGGVTRAVDGVSFQVAQGETLAVVGESGSGKSVTMLSVMRLLDGRDTKTSGAVLWAGADGASRDLRGMDERGLNALRGSEIAMIFQDASASLNPLLTVGDQIAETVRLHEDASRAQAWARAVELLTQVGIAAPESRAHSYPHQLSGGMRQRVMIAIALAGRPRLLIADEPTTALDVTIEAQILQLLEDIQRQQGLSIVIVTHDLGVVGEIADRVVVMYAGQIVESGAARDVLGTPRHPYTAALLACLPQIAGDGEAESPFRRAKPGVVPRIGEGFVGCRFRSRCPLARAECERDVPLVETAPGWQSRCFFWEEAS